MKRYPPHPLTRSEAQRLVEVADNGTLTGLRNKAIVTVLYRTGARCREVCSLTLDDVYPLDDGCAIVRIRRPKGYARGAMPREVGIDKRGAGYLQNYLRTRGEDPGPLFMTSSGQSVIPSYIRALLPRLARAAKITRRIHPHCFRHTFARELYDEGAGLVEIMLALGHTSLTTTQQYLRHIGATEVVNTTTQRSWNG